MDIDGAGYVAHLVGDLLRDVVAALLVDADHLHVDRRGQPEVQNLGDDIGRLEEELQPGNAAAARSRKLRMYPRWDGDA